MLAYFVDLLFEIVFWLIILACFLTWIPSVNWQHPVLKALHDFTETIFAPFRSIIPPLNGIDLSPIVALFALQIVRVALVRLLLMFGI